MNGIEILIAFAIGSAVTTGWLIASALVGIEHKLTRIANALEEQNKREN